LTRRELLVAGLGAPALLAAPSDTVQFGLIGLGPRATVLLRSALPLKRFTVTALCDIDQERLAAAADLVATQSRHKPATYGGGPKDYLNLLARRDVDAVLIATPNEAHAQMAIDAMAAGKHVVSEVPAAVTLEDCWRLVRAVEAARRTYVLAENCCFYRENMIVRNMVRAGLFGETAYTECGYVHDTSDLQFNADGSPNWRSQRAQEVGNRYPTHAVGPVAQWLDINRGDRFASLVSLSSPSVSLPHKLRKRFGGDSPQAKIKFGGDSNMSLIRTAKGKLLQVKYDPYSSRPHISTTYHNLQGSTGSYLDQEGEQRIWLEARSKKYEWQPLKNVEADFVDDLWRRWGDQATQAGHRGSDFVTMAAIMEALAEGKPSPIDVYDGATWSAIIGLSEKSVKSGGQPQEFPDFNASRAC
jgi:predicted dehydrogenase